MDLRQIGPYVVLEQLGAGGMGNVYLARHEETGEVVAVKVLPPDLARSTGFKLRFEREIAALERLESPYIVRLLDSGVDGETYYFAMEYVPGEALVQRLQRERRIPWPTAVRITQQLCLALKVAHAAGVVHRDLKPSNILLARDGAVKLTDFGVAQMLEGDKLTITGGVVGTAEYMSPEQAGGQRATQRSDLYSLGAVLYVMLTGRPPFVGNSTPDLLHKHKFGQFDLPSRYATDAPAQLDAIVAQLLEKDPEKRTPDAQTLWRRLSEVAEAGETLTEQPTPLAPAKGEIVVDRPEARAAGPTTFLRDLVRAEVRRAAEPSWWQKLTDNTWVLLTLLALLIVGVWWLGLRRLTPEQRFAAGEALLRSDSLSDWTRARDEYFLPLLQSDAAAWREKIDPYLRQIETAELEQQLTSRRRGKRSAAQTEPERLLRAARRTWDAGDLDGALRQLADLRTLTGDDPQYDAVRRLAERWSAEAAEQRQQQPDPREFVRSALERAAQLAAAQPEAARAIWEAIIAEYADEPVVRADVETARQRLAETPRAPAP